MNTQNSSYFYGLCVFLLLRLVHGCWNSFCGVIVSAQFLCVLWVLYPSVFVPFLICHTPPSISVIRRKKRREKVRHSHIQRERAHKIQIEKRRAFWIHLRWATCVQKPVKNNHRKLSPETKLETYLHIFCIEKAKFKLINIEFVCSGCAVCKSTKKTYINWNKVIWCEVSILCCVTVYDRRVNTTNKQIISRSTFICDRERAIHCTQYIHTVHIESSCNNATVAKNTK